MILEKKINTSARSQFILEQSNFWQRTLRASLDKREQ
jgi:hypothetical protein